MDFTELYNELKRHKEELEALRRQFQDKMKSKFTDLTAAFFAAAPEVQAIVWNQYTPYWNDGEECNFSVNDLYFITKNFDPDDLLDAYDYEDDEEFGTIQTCRYSWSTGPDHPRREVCKQFDDFVRQNEDLMEEIFGDHVTVYLTPTASISEDYSHD